MSEMLSGKSLDLYEEDTIYDIMIHGRNYYIK